MKSSPRTDFGPTAAWPMLRFRANLLKRLRAFFDEREFLEVETPLLSVDTVVDRYIDPLAVVEFGAESEAPGGRMFLQTSPEFCMKRLLAAGGTAIYQVCKAFRAGEQGRLHNSEFTMVEWYRAGDDYAAGMQLLSDLAEVLLGQGPAERLSYREAFLAYAGFDPLTTPPSQMLELCRAHYQAHQNELRFAHLWRHKMLDVPASLSAFDRDGWLNLLLAECVEPHLGQERPAILYDYPASQSALARVRQETPPVAERFELYVRGIELANGYHELLDPAVLRARNEHNNRLRASDGKPQLPSESRLLAAMEHGLPPCAGVALGFDRLAMVAAGAASIAEVMTFPGETIVP